MRVDNAVGYKERRDGLSQEWCELLDDWNAIPILLPNTCKNIGLLIKNANLVILTGGNDIVLDGRGAIVEGGNNSAIERDTQEYKIIDYCISNSIPILGVCRGMQVLNYYFGGSLKPVDKKNHVGIRHKITILNGPFKGVFGKTKIVNSFHNFGISNESLGDELRVLAVSNDSFVEALYHIDHPIVGIMWHPERNMVFSDMEKNLVMEMINKKSESL
jgi:N5-(cytidine 5'-diphosphoramidyl)-L-glutamine hydrolase